jgi:hypothetical protein
LSAEGKPVAFAADVPIPVIPPGESASVTLGTSNDFITSQADTTYRGSLTFKNASGRSRSVQFVVSAEYERTALVYDEERSRTEFQLQKLPEELRRVSDQLDRLSRIAERRGEGRAVEPIRIETTTAFSRGRLNPLFKKPGAAGRRAIRVKVPGGLR